MEKQEKNYYLEFIKEYKEIRKKEEGKPKLLLHVCCAPCSAYPLVFLQDLFDITILYTNSNIYPKEEYEKRIYYVKKYVNDLNVKFNKHINIIEDDYDYDSFKKELAQYKDNKEGETRCKICIAKRMRKLFDVAKEKNFKYVTTIMSISRNKDASYINMIGKHFESLYNHEIEFVYSDFKKNNGQDIGVQIAKTYSLYRQDYCGCEYSLPLEKKLDNKNYEVSLVLTISKKTKYIYECLNYLLNQKTTTTYEVFAVLDNPTEEVVNIINEYREKYPEILFIYNVNFNDISLSRNYALKNARGRFISFIEPTDYVKENYLEKFYKKAIEHNADIVVSEFETIKNDKLIKPNLKFYFTKRYHDNSDIVIKALFNNVFIRGGIYSKFFKREFLKNYNIFFMPYSSCNEDVFFSFMSFLYAKKIHFINDRLYYHRIHVDKDNFDVQLYAQKLINAWFLCKYLAIKENKKGVGRFSYTPKFLKLAFRGFYYRKNLDVSYKIYLKNVGKQLSKLFKNQYKYEGEEWEKALYLYLEKVKENHY